MPAGLARVNAWLVLDEDQPASTGYRSPNSSFQRLIKERVYQAVDTLIVGFVNTVPTGAHTVPSGDGHSYTVANGPGSHPDGLTDADYMGFVVRDARAANPSIRILAILTNGDLNRDEHDVITRIFGGATDPAAQRAAAEEFAANLVGFLQHWNLDGFDVDWESPVSDGTSAAQFKLVFDAIGAAFRSASPRLMLTLSPAVADNLDAGAVNDNFAFVNLQLYSGFTDREEFTRAHIQDDLLAFGAKFETDPQPSNPPHIPPTFPGHQTARDAYEKALKGGYTVITQWRLNSGNFVFEQDQQKELYKLARGRVVPA